MTKILLPFALCAALPLCAQNIRYLNRVFPSVTQTTDVVYATAPALNFPYFPESNTSNANLTLDIFQPDGDTETARPLIVFIHSGAFLNGSKDNEDMQALCDSFAHRGYVTLSINYRKGFNVLSTSSAERAVYRGLQDAAAAIRFMKHFRSTYKIDTTHVFALGSSAGGFSTLNLAYLDNSERPASTYNSGIFQPNLGCVDCAGNTYPHNHQMKAIASCWGAVGNTGWINASNNNVPAILFHGDQDGTVPYDEGHPFNYQIFPTVYGSLPISQRLSNQGIVHEFYTGEGEDHEYWGTCNGAFCPAPTPYYLDMVYKTALFFYNQLPSTPLPVTLTAFSAIKGAGAVFLQWETASERQFCCFDIERSSNGVAFQTIGRTNAQGNTFAKQSYRFEDEAPTTGTNYYRLKQWDTDGSFQYSPMALVLFHDLQFDVFPNPSLGIFRIKANKAAETAHVKITNALGALVWEGTLGNGEIDLSGQTPGTYLVSIQTGSESLHRQLVLR